MSEEEKRGRRASFSRAWSWPEIADADVLWFLTLSWQHCHAPDDVIKSLDESLGRLRLDYGRYETAMLKDLK